MSRNIDERVLEMRFENRNFERNISQSMSSLTKLRNSLDMRGASRGLESIGESARKVDVSRLGSAVDTVKERFSALEVVAITALVNITNKAIHAGERIISALTIDPIKTGFQEYETKINSIQTILANTASKGTTLTHVNNALEELNTYADKTIYNFTEMTRNIGTFTAAGIDLDTSVQSIKGIANLAAVSGSSSQQASTAMYQLSQALAAGTVKLMDWNSVVNAGMGGEIFKESLMETARVHSVAVDDIIKKEGSFRESLKHGWITAEVLTETLKKFTGDISEAELKSLGYSKKQIEEIIALGERANEAATKVKSLTQLYDTLQEAAQSGWSRSWEIIVGDIEEAKEVYTRISDTISGFINSAADSRNKLLFDGLASGWKKFLNAGIADSGVFIDKLKIVAKEHGVVVEDIIKKNHINNNLGDIFKGGWVNADILSKSLHLMAQEYTGLTEEQIKQKGVTKEQVEALLKFDEQVKNGTISMEDFANQINRASGRENIIEGFANIYKGIVSIIKPIHDAYREVFKPLTGDQLYAFTESFRNLTSHFKLTSKASKNLKDTFKGLFSVIDFFIKRQIGLIKLISGGSSVFTNLADAILSVTGAIGRWLTAITNSISPTAGFNEIGEALSNIFSNINKAIDGLTNNLKSNSLVSLFDSILLGIKNAVHGILGLLKELGRNIKETLAGNDNFGFLDILNTGLTAGFGVGLFKILRGFSESFGNVREILDSLGDAFEGFQLKLKAEALLKISFAIAVLAGSLLLIASIDSEKLTGALASVTALFGNLFGTMMLFDKLKIGPGLRNAARSMLMMVGLSTSILILASALKKISDLDTEALIRGLVGMTTCMGLLVGSLKILQSKDQMFIKGASQLIALSIAVNFLAIAVKSISNLEWENLARGLIGVGTLLGSLLLFTRFSKLEKVGFSAGAGILALTVGINLLVHAVKSISQLQDDRMVTGLVAIASALGIIVGIFKILDKVEGSILKGGSAIAIVSASMILLAGSLKIFASINDLNTIQALIALGGALGILAIALNVMEGTIPGAVALSIVSASLLLLAPALVLLGTMDLKSIGIALLGLAGAFTVIGVAGAVLGPLVPVLLALSVAIGILGVAVLAAGTGLLVAGVGLAGIATGIVALEAALATGVTSIVGSLTIILKGIASLIPELMKQFGIGLVELCRVISNGAPEIGEAIKAMLLTSLDVFTECTPKIVDSLLTFIVETLKSLSEKAPLIVGYILDFIIGIIDSIAEHIPELVKSGIELLTSLFTGIVDSLKDLDTSTIVESIAGIGLLSGILLALAALSSLIAPAMTGVLGLGVLIGELALVLAAIGALAQIPGLNWFIGEGANLLKNIGNAIGGFVGSIVGGVLEGISSSLPKLGNDLSQFMINLQPFISGASNINPSVVEGVKTLAETVLILTAANILEGITSWFTGGSSITKFAEDLAELAPSLKSYSDSVAGLDPNIVTNSTNAAKALAELANNLPNSGGIVSWFTGDNDMASFGQNLASFGAGFASYYSQVSVINVTQLSGVTTEFKKLLDVLSGVERINSNGLGSFTQNLINIARNGITGFITEFNNATSKVKSAGDKLVTDLISGINNKKQALKTETSNLASEGVKSIEDKKSDYERVGKDLISKLNTAIKDGRSSIEKSFLNIVNSAISTIRSKYYDFELAGKYLATGVANGISSNSYMVEAKARAMAQAASNAAKNELKIKSPSRVGIEIGKFYSEGVSIGIERNTEGVITSVTNMASLMKDTLIDKTNSVSEFGDKFTGTVKNGLSSVLSKISDLVDADLNLSPTIKPVIDLSNVDKGAKRIKALLSTNKALSIDHSIRNTEKVRKIQNDSKESEKTGNVYKFTQNNYSPKALSRIEIYRQTRNQFSLLKGLT